MLASAAGTTTLGVADESLRQHEMRRVRANRLLGGHALSSMQVGPEGNSSAQ